MQRDVHKLKLAEAKHRQMEDTNRQMRLRIQVRVGEGRGGEGRRGEGRGGEGRVGEGRGGEGRGG